MRANYWITPSRLFALSLALFPAAGAQAAQQHENPCAAPEYHQLDFILGSWNVVDASTGTKVAELEIKPVTESDCGLMETVHGGLGGGGNGQMAYSRALGGWVYLFTYANGISSLLHDSHKTTNGMSWRLTRWTPSGIHESIYSFTREPDGRVRVLSVYADNSGRKDYEVYWVKR